MNGGREGESCANNTKSTLFFFFFGLSTGSLPLSRAAPLALRCPGVSHLLTNRDKSPGRPAHTRVRMVSRVLGCVLKRGKGDSLGGKLDNCPCVSKRNNEKQRFVARQKIAPSKWWCVVVCGAGSGTAARGESARRTSATACFKRTQGWGCAARGRLFSRPARSVTRRPCAAVWLGGSHKGDERNKKMERNRMVVLCGGWGRGPGQPKMLEKEKKVNEGRRDTC